MHLTRKLESCVKSFGMRLRLKHLSVAPLLLTVVACANAFNSYQGDDLHRPNIVFIVADDHGTDAIGVYGNRVIKTPNLDELAADGIRFTNAFATASSCSPSRAALLTGLHAHANGTYGLEHGIHGFESFDSVKSVSTRLSEVGYRTARIGKFHIGPEDVFKFDYVLSEWLANSDVAGARNPVGMANEVEDFISQSNQPFFLYFATDDPHRMFPFDTGDHPNSFGNKPAGYQSVETIKYDPIDVTVPTFLPDSDIVRRELAEYYQSVSRLDQGIGRLMDVLRDTGTYENTLIIYLSDNGVAFPAAKTNLYDPGIRLPLIVKPPHDRFASELSDALVSWVDIVPTLLDYAGALAPSTGDGHSLHALLEGNIADFQARNSVYGSHVTHEIMMYYPMRMVRTKDYKFIWNIAHELPFPMARDLYESPTWQSTLESDQKTFGRKDISSFSERPEFELYDLKNDPQELENLSGDMDYNSIEEAFVEELKEFQTRTNDPWIRKWDYE